MQNNLNAQFDLPPADPCVDSMEVNLTFTGTGADSIIWDLGDGTIYANSNSISHYYTVQDTFYIQMTAFDLECNHVDSIQDTAIFFSENTLAQATAPPNVELCTSPYLVDFEASSNTPDHFWNFGDGDSSTDDTITHQYASIGTYNVMYVAIDSSTCNIADTAYFNVQVNQSEQLSLSIDIPTPDPCADSTQMLVEIDFTGTGADSLTFDMGDGTNYSNQFNIDHYYTSQGSFVITAYAADTMCDVDTTITVPVDFYVDYTETQAMPPLDIELCTQPYEVTFEATGVAPNYYWNFGDGNTSEEDTTIHTYGTTGTYTVTYAQIDSSTCNIGDTVTFTVQINQAEQFAAEFAFEPPPPCGSDSMLVELAFTGSGADSLEWDMGNGTLLNDSAIQYYYTEGGIYTVTLTAWDFYCDHVGSISEDVTYFGNMNTETIIPNIFSPDGDGINDNLTFINLDGTSQFKITIWNRWGVEIFESDDSSNPWDGNASNGQPAKASVYYYEVTYVNMCDDEIKIIPGFVHLVRGM